QLRPLLSLVTAWFWGDESAMRIYSPYMGVLARSIGSSGMPIPSDESLSQSKQEIPATFTNLGRSGEFSNLTFATLDLGDSAAEVKYYENRDGTAVLAFAESLGPPAAATA